MSSPHATISNRKILTKVKENTKYKNFHHPNSLNQSFIIEFKNLMNHNFIKELASSICMTINQDFTSKLFKLFQIYGNETDGFLTFEIFLFWFSIYKYRQLLVLLT